MRTENFLEFAVKATCIFCHAEIAFGAESFCNDDGDLATDVAKKELVATFEAAGWHVIEVASKGGLPSVVGMACPKCTVKGVKLFE